MGTQLGGSGADFWGPKYGLDNFEAFNAAVSKLLPDFLPFGNLGMNDTAIGLAWNVPWSNPGVLAQSLLTADGYSGTDRTTAGQMLQIPAGAVANSTEGTSMTQLIIPGCFQVTIKGTSGGQDVDNVIGVQNSSGTAGAAAAAVQTAWKIASGPLALQQNAYSTVSYTAVDIGSSNGEIAVITDSTAGSLTGSLATNAASALIKWNGGTRSRSSRGRMYFGPLGETSINPDGRTLLAGSIAAFQSAFTNFRNSLAASGYPLVVLSRTLSTAFPVTSHSVEQVIATQRRRIRA